MILFLLLSLSVLLPKIYSNNNSIEINELNILFIHIPKGEFIMGQTDKEKEWLIKEIGKRNYKRFSSDERPAHKVYLSEYWISDTEITVKQFAEFISETGYITDAEKKGNSFIRTKNKWGKVNNANWKNPGFIQNDNHPVVCVSWFDSVEFCKWLSKKTGYTITLPTEAQWEKAASGKENTIYPWGNKALGGKFANYADKKCWEKYKINWSNKSVNDNYAATAPVGNYPKGNSSFNIKDMAGNVWEWCQDTYSNNYYSKSPKNNPTGPSKKGYFKVLRGGSWGDSINTLRKSKRFRFTPIFRSDILGFRPVIIKNKD